MFIIDKLLLSPIFATVWAARQIQKAIEQERVMEPELITAQLSELYMMLETGRISEQEFQFQEKDLLDRLEEIQEQEPSIQENKQTDLESAGEKVTVRQSPTSG